MAEHEEGERVILWTIDEVDLTEMLRRAAGGEDVDLILLEAAANAEHSFGDTVD